VLRARLGDERGVSLLLSLILMSALSLTTVGVITYTSAGGRTASLERSRVSARAVAEAGLNNAISVLYNAVTAGTNPTVNPTSLLPAPGQTPRSWNVLGGTATVTGAYTGDGDDGLWTIASTGTVPNPTGGAQLTRTLTQTVEVHGVNEGGYPGDWNRMVHEDPSPGNCLTISGVTIPTPVRSGGCIVMEGDAHITGATTTVDAGSTVTMVGDSGTDTGDPPDTATGWTNSTEVRTNDGDEASASMAHNADSATLDMKDFDFAIPANATITGIRVRVGDRFASNSNAVRDLQVQLLRASSPAAGSDNKAASGYWGTGTSTVTYGGSTDTWHPTTAWTAADINSTGFGVRFRAHNDHNSSTRTAYVDWVDVTVYWELQPQASIGASGQNVAEANVVQTCKWGTQSANAPCSPTDKVWSNAYTQGLPEVVKPEVDLDYWYRHAKPGPAHPCNDAGGSFAGGFDNNYSAANPHPDNSRNQSYTGAEVTPETGSYHCKVIENGVTVGEISWNRTTRVLTIKGTIYIDGDFRFDDDGTVVHYQGKGIIFASGKLEFDEVVCAGGSGTTSCLDPIVNGRSTNIQNWDPTQNLLTVLSGGMGSGIGSEFDQGSSATQGSYNHPGALQGLIYSEDDCQVHQWFHLSGPIICREIDLPLDSGWYKPEYYTWPDLTNLTNGQKWRAVSDASDWALVPKEITG
jgi:hypothetical protein